MGSASSRSITFVCTVGEKCSSNGGVEGPTDDISGRDDPSTMDVIDDDAFTYILVLDGRGFARGASSFPSVGLGCCGRPHVSPAAYTHFLVGDPRRFGDTMNTSSRMESNGEMGLIHVSSTTAEPLVEDGKGSTLAHKAARSRERGSFKLITYFPTRVE